MEMSQSCQAMPRAGPMENSLYKQMRALKTEEKETPAAGFYSFWKLCVCERERGGGFLCTVASPKIATAFFLFRSRYPMRANRTSRQPLLPKLSPATDHHINNVVSIYPADLQHINVSKISCCTVCSVVLATKIMDPCP